MMYWACLKPQKNPWKLLKVFNTVNIFPMSMNMVHWDGILDQTLVITLCNIRITIDLCHWITI